MKHAVLTAILFSVLINGCSSATRETVDDTATLDRKGPVIQTNEHNFESDVLAAKQPVLVDVYADWCGPCKMLAPVIDKMATSDEYKDKMKFMRLNADRSPNICQKYAVQALPTVLIFVNGKMKASQVGLVRKDILDMRIQESLAEK